MASRAAEQLSGGSVGSRATKPSDQIIIRAGIADINRFVEWCERKPSSMDTEKDRRANATSASIWAVLALTAVIIRQLRADGA